jgi:hypothetical protein
MESSVSLTWRSLSLSKGANGDHADQNNRFRVVFVSLDDLQNNTNAEQARVRTTNVVDVLPDVLQILDDNIEAQGGSRPDAYSSGIRVPNIRCNKCVLAVLDQRNWGGCIDIRVTGTLPPATTVPFVPDVCGNGKVERSIGEQCEPALTPCCTATCQYGAAISGCPCIDFDCKSPFFCECEDAATCGSVEPKCQRTRNDRSDASVPLLTLAAAVVTVAAAL